MNAVAKLNLVERALRARSISINIGRARSARPTNAEGDAGHRE